MRASILILLFFQVGFAYGQYPPTFWPSLDGVSLDFREEPPRLDTFIKPCTTQYINTSGYAGSITDKSGNQLGYFLGTDDSTMLTGFYGMNHTLVSKHYIQSPRGVNFISFEDSVHYLVFGGNADNATAFFWSGNTVLNDSVLQPSIHNNAPYVATFKQLKIYGLQIDTGILRTEHSLITNAGSKRLIAKDKIISTQEALYYKNNGCLYAIYPVCDFVEAFDKYDTLLLRSGLVRVDLNSDLSVKHYKVLIFSEIILGNVLNYNPRITTAPLAINKSGNMLVVSFKTKVSSALTYDTLALVYFDDSFNLIKVRKIYDLNKRNSNITPNGVALSPNDSFIYTITNTHKPEISYSIDTLYQINTNTGSSHPLPITMNYSPWLYVYGDYSKVQLAPNGKIYFRARTGDSINPYYYSVISRPNLEFPKCKVTFNVFKSGITRYNSSGYYTHGGFYNANKPPLNPFYVYTEQQFPSCGGNYFSNQSDSPYSTFVWYWGDGDSSISLLSDKLVNHRYPRNGQYFLKVKGITPTGYWGWFSDSITTQCFLKANFYTNDSVGCQWVSQIFYDSSCLNSAGHSPGTRWLWHFGDGDSLETSHPFATHIFRQSGSFDVRMKIMYGGCEDTITKTSVIRILAAPKPGFTLDKTSACIPPPATFVISDTVEQLVQKKTYRFFDSGPDSLFSPMQHNLSYTYATKGRYYITQTLHSPTGCITKEMQGVTVYDNLLNAITPMPAVSVNEQEKVAVFWKRNPDVLNYHVFKETNSGTYTLLKTTPDTFVLDLQAGNVAAQTYLYALQYTDYCNNQSPRGNAETSMLLKARNYKNAYSILDWNQPNAIGFPYRFEIYRERDSSISTVKNVSGPQYYDYAFYADSGTKTCYTIFVKQQDSFMVSSNTVCLSYEPTLIIPTLYDPVVFPNGLPIRASYLNDFTLEIFDILGRKVYEGQNPERWFGADNHTQHFFYRVSGVSRTGSNFAQIGRILLVK